MIRSMTAYATAERATEDGTLACELRAVNHRFLELGLRLPEELRVLEPALRERISARIARGKLDFSLRLRSPEGEGGLQLNATLVRQLSELALDMTARFPALRTEFIDLLQYPGVLQARSTDAEVLQAEALALLDTLLDQFVGARGQCIDPLPDRHRQLFALALARADELVQQRVQQRQRLGLQHLGIGRARLQHARILQ